jgi:Tol biopolymer transport system component
MLRRPNGLLILLLMLSPLALAAGNIELPPAQASAGGEESDNGEEGKDEGLPLEPSRNIRFETDEVTWMSLDLSPDGQTIIFDLLGDIYTVSVEGGDATALLTGLPFESQPAWSPDGSLIAFVSDRDGSENLWIANADGSEPRKLSSETKGSLLSPEFSADGDYVFVSKSNWGLSTYEIWMFHVDGGTGVQVTSAKPDPSTPRNQRHNAVGASASSDGRYLYYAQKSGGFAYNVTFPLWQVVRRDLQEGTEDVVVQAQGSAIRPEVSPDGRYLVYGTRHDAQTGLRVRNLETGDDRWLIYPVQRDEQESVFSRDLLPTYSFTADGDALILSFDGGIRRVSIADGSVTEIPFNAAVDAPVGPLLGQSQESGDGPVRARIIQSPQQSPDGSTIVFSALTSLYTMDLDGGAPERLTDDGDAAFQPSWSPDGRWVTYISWTNAGGHVYKVRANGRGNPVQLTRDAAFYSDPVFTPDGGSVVVLRGSNHARMNQFFDNTRAPAMDLVRVPADGGSTTLIAHANALGGPHFSNEPDRVYLYSQAGLMSMRLDGTDRRSHVQVKGPGLYFAEEPVPADNVRISPDGNWALAHVGNQLHVVAVPQISRDAQTVDVSGPAVPSKQLTDIGADYFDWADGGRTMTWAVGSTFYRQPFDTVEFRAEESNGEDNGDGNGEVEEAEEPPLYESFEIAVEVPRDRPEGTVVLRGARVLTMADAGVIERADVVVERNRIQAVGESGTLSIPEGAEVIDVTGKTIVPGFIDSHAHWFEIRRGILDTGHWAFLANLAYGVTAGLDVQTSTNDQFAYQDLIDAGTMVGLRAFSTGPGVFSNNEFKSKEQAVGVLKRYRDHYGTRNIKAYLSGNRKQRQFVIQASEELGMMPTTEGGLDLKLDLTQIADGFWGTEHTLPVFPLYRDIVQFLVQSGSTYTPALLVMYGGPWAEEYFFTNENPHDDPKIRRFMPHFVVDSKSQRRLWFRDEEHAFDRAAAEAAKIQRAGGLVGVGSHGQFQGLGYHWEMWALSAGGMEPMEVLEAATIDGAEIIGRHAEIGSLAPGKFADLVILDANPLDDIRNTNSIDRVMQNGRIYDAATMDQVWPEARPLEPLWFWEDDPDPRTP